MLCGNMHDDAVNNPVSSMTWDAVALISSVPRVVREWRIERKLCLSPFIPIYSHVTAILTAIQ